MNGIKHRIGKELRSIAPDVRLQPTVILLGASVLLTVYRYYGSPGFFDGHLARFFAGTDRAPLYGTLYGFFSCFFLMLVVPAVLIRCVLKKRVGEFGLRAGETRVGLAIVGLLLPLIVVLLLWPASRQAAFRAEYPLFRGAGRTLTLFVAYELLYAVYYLGWEFFFRGFMLFGLKDSVGAANSILIQTIPSTLLHIGKPDGEIFAAIVAGIAFGAIALRTRSILYVFLLHWLIGVALDVFIVFGPG